MTPRKGPSLGPSWPLRSVRYLLVAVAVAGCALGARTGYARSLARHTKAENPSVRTSDGVLLFTEEEDRHSAPVTVLFAHGFAATSQEFTHQRRALSERARVVLFDQRGHGSSGWGDPTTATIEQLGNDLGCVIDQQPQQSRILLVAHSMGGMGALALAAQRPELFGSRIAGVALLSTAAGRLPSMEVPARVGRLAVRTGAAGLATRLLWLVAPVLDWVVPFRRRWGRRWLLHRLFGGDGPTEEAADTMLTMWNATPLSMVTAFYPALVRYNKMDGFDALRSVPVLVLSGTDDHAIDCERSCTLASEIGDNARLVTVEGAGHMVNLTHPDEVNDALLDLLAKMTLPPG